MKLWRNPLWSSALGGAVAVSLLTLPAGVGETKNENKAVVMGTASGLGEHSPCG